MNIAIVGTGNVGGALARKWSAAGHQIHLGVREADFKGKELLDVLGISAHSISEAVELSEVVLLATPSVAAIEVAQSLGETEGKVIIDAMNIIAGRGPEGYANTSQAILDHTGTHEVVKCFNTTGFNNMLDPVYGDQVLDMFVCGDSDKGKSLAKQLALDAGFADCIDIGGNDKFELMEQFAWFWINLAMFQGQGREIGMKLLRR